ncbi:MAG: hypothetical protein GX209_04795 [Epulopiscium sp.]|nr:hypothetical protein [Candidatus Epulonipiscium sp.]
METTASIVEVHEILRSEHRDPHHILGMHEIEVNGKKAVAVRAFIPQAASIKVIDDANPEQIYEMKKIFNEGFFEAVLLEHKKFRYRLTIVDYLGNKWTTYDPYFFNPYISDFDKYLFGQGTHYKIYEKLGAHTANKTPSTPSIFMG